MLACSRITWGAPRLKRVRKGYLYGEPKGRPRGEGTRSGGGHFCRGGIAFKAAHSTDSSAVSDWGGGGVVRAGRQDISTMMCRRSKHRLHAEEQPQRWDRVVEIPPLRSRGGRRLLFDRHMGKQFLIWVAHPAGRLRDIRTTSGAIGAARCQRKWQTLLILP